MLYLIEKTERFPLLSFVGGDQFSEIAEKVKIWEVQKVTRNGVSSKIKLRRTLADVNFIINFWRLHMV
jgi:hypothetical protein